jgi:NAD(P)-dependent dehydrogenase (short-subunit alcohol dehydrogenase family)
MSSVLITGANRGIGLATAVAMARAGHTVYATMRDVSKRAELDQAAAGEGLTIHVSELDVTSDESVASAIAAVQQASGGIEVLINNAGIERRGSAEEIDLDTVREVMETNFFGSIRCMQACIPGMRQRGEGCIVNVASVAGRIAVSPFGPYTASKFALEAFSETTAQELKPHGIRVLIVEPGIIDTGMAQGIGEPVTSDYPHARRIAGMFRAALETPTSPTLVADAIVDAVDSGTWTLRHPVGPDAVPFLEWRAGMTDEEWVDWSATDDDAWYAAVQEDFGLDAKGV